MQNAILSQAIIMAFIVTSALSCRELETEGRSAGKESASLFGAKSGNIPDDIRGKVRELFPDEADQVYILQKLRTLWQMPLNVGPDQLARGILVLSGSSRSEFDALFDGDFMGDPRDLLGSAEEKLGNPGHYCTEPFGPDLSTLYAE